MQGPKLDVLELSEMRRHWAALAS